MFRDVARCSTYDFESFGKGSALHRLHGTSGHNLPRQNVAWSNGPGEGLTPEQQKFDALARGWLGDARFTKEIVSTLAKEIDREARAQARMTEIERTLYGKSQRMLLERI